MFLGPDRGIQAFDHTVDYLAQAILKPGVVDNVAGGGRAGRGDSVLDKRKSSGLFAGPGFGSEGAFERLHNL